LKNSAGSPDGEKRLADRASGVFSTEFY
jgi:hypothetical protein